METIKSVFTTYRFDVEVITPIHVGMVQEKNYVRGLDYVLDNGQVWLIDTDKLFRLLTKAELQDLTLKLAQGNTSSLESLFKTLLKANPAALLQKMSIQGAPSDGVIKRLYRTGLGQYAIPGSSLKGAIRSVLLAELKKKPGSNLRQDELEPLMGSIDSNLMRYVQVGDIALPTEAIAVRRTKIFSADSDHQNVNTRGEWKHGFTQNGNGKHSPAFTDSRYGADAFVTFYEMATPMPFQTEPPTLTLRLGSNLPGKLGEFTTGYKDNGQDNVPNYRTLLKDRDGAWLIKTIRAHTKQYLERERAYFQKFGNTTLNTPQPILDRLDALMAHNAEPDSCLLRVGAGVGFHSITGDWQQRSQNHFSDWNANKNAIYAKTRKFIFTEQNRDVDFALMGFLKLILQTPESVSAREQKQELARQQAETQHIANEQAARLAAEAEAERLEAERQVREVNKRTVFEGKVKKGTPLNAEVTAVTGAKATLKLYVTAEVNQPMSITYNGLTVGDFLAVEVKDVSGKGKIMAVGFKRFL